MRVQFRTKRGAHGKDRCQNVLVLTCGMRSVEGTHKKEEDHTDKQQVVFQRKLNRFT